GAGAEVLERAGAWCMFDGVDSPLSQTFGLGLFETATDEDLDAIESFFRERGAAIHHEICPLSGVELTGRLVERGYRPVEMSTALFRPLEPGLRLAGSRNPKIVVREIGDDEGEVWAQTAAEGWSDFGDMLELMKQVAQINLRREDASLFLAELDGQAIGAAGMIGRQDAALLAGASTVAAYRRQGCQLALLEARMRAAADAGLRLCTMAAEPGSGSQRNAERHGFRVAYTRTKWRLA
ncbi:MAG: GNAT family N-acetyltransferase, partial [Planctomycetes bacterium]|nr:GNAT family N-acetyltransferase [Planctomycetota bacterium]